MKKRLLAGLLAAAVSACAVPSSRIAIAPRATSDVRNVVLRVQVKEGDRLIVRSVPLEEYVAAAVLSEVDPPAADSRVIERMYEVQAVLARTYALAQRGRHASQGFDLCSGTHCQLYQPARLRTSKWSSIVQDAVHRTEGRLLWYGAKPATAVFHADCGGHTSSAADVWGGAAPAYLAGERDEGAAARAHVEWRFETRLTDLRDALNSDPRTRVGARLDSVAVVVRDPAGRAERIAIRGSHPQEVRGEVFREVVSRARGVKTLQSTLFTIQRTRDGLVFNGKGFGHGVGLCQKGAFARLTAGALTEQVLAFYFPGTVLSRATGAKLMLSTPEDIPPTRARRPAAPDAER